jgi:hypothetical protein
MEILKGVIKKSLIIILPVAAVSAFFEWKKLPLGIIIGGVFGILNMGGLVRSVRGVIGSSKTTAKIIFLSMTRLFILFTAIFILIWLEIINILGMLFGFTVVFVLILVEGMIVGKKG